MTQKSHLVIRECCPVCQQGRVFVVLGPTHKENFVMCEDCESEWDGPEMALAAMPPTRGTHSFIRYANMDDIEGDPWVEFVLNR